MARCGSIWCGGSRSTFKEVRRVRRSRYRSTLRSISTAGIAVSGQFGRCLRRQASHLCFGFPARVALRTRPNPNRLAFSPAAWVSSIGKPSCPCVQTPSARCQSDLSTDHFRLAFFHRELSDGILLRTRTRSTKDRSAFIIKSNQYVGGTYWIRGNHATSED